MTERAQILAALASVRDPELDEPVTDLGFVSSCVVSAAGDVQVRLRLPTYFCAPNFAFLMVADAYDAVSQVAGVRHAEVILDDHFAADAINAGVAARSGFVQAFGELAADELDDLRTDFVRKAVLAGTDRVCRPCWRPDAASTSSPATDAGGRPQLDELAGSPWVTSRRHPTWIGCALGAPSSACLRMTIRHCSSMPSPENGGRRGGAAAAPATRPADPGQPRGERQHLRRDAAAPLRN